MAAKIGKAERQRRSRDLMNLWIGARYHAQRRGFLRGIHHSITWLSALSGSAAFLAVLGKQDGWAQVLTAAVALLQVAESVVRFGEKAALHSELTTGFSHLRRRAADARSGPERLWLDIRAAHDELEGRCPTRLNALVLSCTNDYLQRNGQAYRYRVSALKMWTRQVISWGSQWESVPISTPENMALPTDASGAQTASSNAS